MNDTWLDEMIRGYYTWLGDNTIVKYDSMTDWYAIDTPFVGLFNDRIEIYVKKDNDKFILSDDGDTLSNLEMKGINVSRSSTRRSIINGIELNFGVSIKDGEITTEATKETFNSRKHALLQAIQQVSDLRMTAKREVVSMFSEDFKQYLDNENIVYTPQFTLVGKSGLNFFYDFQIAGKTQETVIRTFNHLSKNSVTDVLFGIQDVRENREINTRKTLNSIVIVNDLEQSPKSEYFSALSQYGCKTLLWSQKGKEWNASALISA